MDSQPYFYLPIPCPYQLKTLQSYKLNLILTSILTLLTYKLFLNFFSKILVQFKHFVYLRIINLKQYN